MPTTVALALIVAATLAVLLTVGIGLRRAHRETRAALTHGLLGLSDRLDGLARELESAVKTIREEGLRARILESLGGTLDLDEVVLRCAEAAVSLPGVAAAAVAVDIDGSLHSAAVGVDPSSIGATVGPSGNAAVRAVGLSYHYREADGAAGQMRSAVAVPVESERGRLGFLTVFGRAEEPPVAGAEFLTLEAIAHEAGSAIEKAARRASLPPPVTDPLTGLPNRQELHETLALEVARAHRDGRTLAICVLDVDDLATANTRLGQAAADGILGQIAALLREAIRPADLAYRCGGDEFAVVLPSSGRIEAEAMSARIQASMDRLPRPLGYTPSLSAGIAELEPDDDGVSLFERAERGLRRAKKDRDASGSRDAGARRI